ncbi:MAG: hypothetical protein QXP98_00645 [Thermoproteus sp.]
MKIVRRRLIRIRGSYIVYLPKPFADGLAEVEMFHEGDFVGVRAPRVRRAEARWADDVEKLVVAAYSAGLDELVLRGVPPGGGEKLAEAVGLVEGSLELRGDVAVVKFADTVLDKSAVIDRMLRALLYAAEGLSSGLATRLTLDAVDREVDRLRLVVNRLCVRYPTPSCALYVQLARYFERAVDHLVELARGQADRRLYGVLAGSAAKFAEILKGDPSEILKFLESLRGERHLAIQLSSNERDAIHAARFLDYLANAAEVYLDVHMRRSSTPVD